MQTIAFVDPFEQSEKRLQHALGAQVALIELHHLRKILEIRSHSHRAIGQIVEGFAVVRVLVALGVGDEYRTLGAEQHGFAGAVVGHLSRHSEQLEFDKQFRWCAKSDGYQIEKRGAVVARFQCHEVTAQFRTDLLVQLSQIGRFAAQRRPVANQFKRDWFEAGRRAGAELVRRWSALPGRSTVPTISCPNSGRFSESSGNT